MVVVNHLAGVRVAPGWMKHAPDIGLTFVDVIAPAFLFAIGLTYRMSFERRLAATGRQTTVRHFVVRWLAIIGIGSLITAGETITGATGRVAEWGVLQSIGVAGLLSLPLILRSWKVRLVASILVLAVVVPISRLRISASYTLVSVGISGMVFSAVLALGRVEIRPLQWWGRNPLLLYVLHYVLLGLVVLPSVDRWYEGAPAWLAAVQSVVLVGCLTVVAWWMNGRNRVLKL